jgi:putative MATE family efflux protein
MTNTTMRTSRGKHIFQLLKEALKGEELDYTSGSINRAIFLLSVPMVLEMLMESVFALVDAFFVSKIGKSAVATVGLTESMLTIIYSLAIGLSMAATAVIARRVGEKNPEKASQAAMQAIYLTTLVSIAISFVGIFYSRDLLILMGADASITTDNYHYTEIMLTGNIVIMMIFLINGIFRGAGNAAIAMKSLWLANLLNIILCPTLINGLGPIPAFGLKGAAIATTIGRGCGVLYQLYHLFNDKGMIKIKMPHLKPDFSVMGNIARIAAGGTGQFLIASASWIFLVRIISRFGNDAIAGYTIAIRILLFALQPSWGMSNAAATLVGQNLGAGHPERAEQSVWRTAFYNMCFLAVVGVISIVFAEQLLGFFIHDEPAVIQYGKECIIYVCMGYLFYAYGMVLAQSFNGAGDTLTPTILNLFGFWFFQIPLAYLVAVVWRLGPKGVFMCIAIAESAMAIVAILLFRRGRWKKVKV